MSDDASNEIIEAAKAVQATAKTASDVITVVDKTGSFLNKIFGDLIEDSVGIVADKIKYYRLNNYMILAQNTTDRMRQKGYSEDDITKVVPLKIAIPLIENATLEDDEELQKLWAQMLANAMDLNFNIDIKLRHISLMREMEPIDLRILDTIYSQLTMQYENKPLEGVLFEKSRIVHDFHMPENQIEISLLNLMRLGCIKSYNLETPLSFNLETPLSFKGKANTINLGTDCFTISQIGLELCQAAMTS